MVPFPSPSIAIIPAKAGIRCVGGSSPQVCKVDSRFRGNDGISNESYTKRYLSF
jgi:hypothetical protein